MNSSSLTSSHHIPLTKEAVLDHVAIAVKSLENAQKIYQDIGFTFEAEKEVVASQGVQVLFAAIDTLGEAHIELLEPLNEQSSVHQFIEKHGEGIHHLCFRVKDVQKLTEDLKAKGYRLLYNQAVPGAGGALVNFIHPKSSHGVLIEISQKD